MSIADEIAAVFASRGSSLYYGESVSTAQHCLQAAYFAASADAPPPLVIAALLHDVGHLVVQVPDDFADWTRDARHEEIGGQWLAARFPRQISTPVRLHVPAKRYLCATDCSYFSGLSAASVATLALQGGPMSRAEILWFEAEPYWQDAIRLRRWDDQGKVAGLATPQLEDYRVTLEQWATPGVS